VGAPHKVGNTYKETTMERKTQWKLAGATLAVAGLGLGGMLGASADDSSHSPADEIRLRDPVAVTDVAPPAPLVGPVDDRNASPGAESVDSPLESPDDSRDDRDSVDTAGESSRGESRKSPVASRDDSPGKASVDTPEQPAARGVERDDSPDRGSDRNASIDSPEPASAPRSPALAPTPPPAPAPAPATASAPADDSYDSPAAGSVDSPS
jgi:hypothetical protein